MSSSREHIQLHGGSVDLVQRTVQLKDTVQRLTTMELRLLTYFHERPGELISTETLLVDIWGYRASTNTRAVSHAILRLRKKIEQTPSSPVHLVTEFGVGYRWLPSASQPTEASQATSQSPTFPVTPDGHHDERASDASRSAPHMVLPDPSFPISAAQARRLHQLRPDLEKEGKSGNTASAIRARLMVAWSTLLTGAPCEPEGLWRDAELADNPALRRLCAVLALRAVTVTGTQPAVLLAADRVNRQLQTGAVDDEIARSIVALTQCTALGRLGDFDGAQRALDEASVRAEQLGHAKLMALVSDRLSYIGRRTHRFRSAAQHAHDANQLLAECDCIETQIDVIHNTATLHYDRGELDDAHTAYMSALVLAETLGARVATATIRASLVSVSLNQGNTDAAQDHLDALCRVESSGDQRRRELSERYHQARIHIEQKQLDQAADGLLRAIHLAGRIGERRLGGYCSLLLAWIELMQLKLEDAMDTLEALEETLEDIDDHELIGAHALWSMWTASLQGQPVEPHATQARTHLKTARSALAVFVGGRHRSGQEWLLRRCRDLLHRHPALQGPPG